MPRFEQDPDVRALGEALAILRRDRGLSQAEAGALAGMTSQGWGLYEAGKRPGLFRPDVQRRLTSGLDASPEDLALVVARNASNPVQPDDARPAGVQSGGRNYVPDQSVRPASSTERIQLSNDDLAPWAASGVMLDVDPDRWPRRDQGCVIDMIGGSRLIRLYDRADEHRIHVRGGPGGLDYATVIDRHSIRRVAAVVARREP